ncbi:MAG: purine-binding chemotaxis protein CheW [Myxococcales bacterium]|nr:purine-binding chemotaxis protein CheW [Myxococcales bacterium]
MTNKDAGPNRPPSRTTKGGKYLTFALGAQEYGLPLLRVREIMAMMDVTPVPLMPSYVRGVMNLRGKVIPVVDLRRKLGMTSTPDHDRKCIIVVDVERTAAEGGRPAGGPLQMSILVDAVSEVLFIGEDDIEAATAMGGSRGGGHISGLAKARGSVKILLDIDDVLASWDPVSPMGGLQNQHPAAIDPTQDSSPSPSTAGAGGTQP